MFFWYRFSCEATVLAGAPENQPDTGSTECGPPQTEPGGDPSARTAPPLHQHRHSQVLGDKDWTCGLL